MTRKTILFTGKHRVNFAMYEPVYQHLRRSGLANLAVSSGRYRLRPVFGWMNPEDPTLRNENIFPEFDIAPGDLIKTGRRDPFPYDVVVNSNADSKLKPRNSRASAQLFHGVSFRNFSVREHYLNFSKLFFPGRYHLEQYIERGLLKEGDPRIALIGMPKLDRLVDGTVKREDVLRGMGLDPALPTVLWAPTGARYNGYELLGPGGLRAIQDLGVNLIVKLHDHPHLCKNPVQTMDDLENEIRSNLGERGRLAQRSDVAPLLVAADALVSDASSVAYEYCVLDRPIVFIDVPLMLHHVLNGLSEAADMNTHGRKMGRIVSSAEEMAEALTHALAHPGEHSAERRAAADHLFYKPGTATQRAADLLLEMAGVGATTPPAGSDNLASARL